MILSIDPVRRDKKNLPFSNLRNSILIFFVSTIVGIPLFITTLFPVILFTNIYKKVFGKKKSGQVEDQKDIETTIVAEPSLSLGSIKAEISEREYDLVLYGATGFTGKLCAEYLTKTYGIGENNYSSLSGKKNFKWAIAGRR
jgi:hypothetical protein